MFHPISQFVTLAVSGLIATMIGALILIDPVAFHVSAGIDVGSQTALTNELKAAGSTVLMTGILALTAIALVRLRATALIVSALVYGSYGLGRVWSFLADGIPNTALVSIAVLELVIAAACIVVLSRYFMRAKPAFS